MWALMNGVRFKLRARSLVALAVGLAVVFGFSAALSAQTAIEEEDLQLVGTDTQPFDHFGNSVAIEGDTMVVGAAFANGGTNGQGAAYVFERSNGAWVQRSKLIASDGATDDEFGSSVSISGDTVLVGAGLGDAGAGDEGAAYVFTRTGNSWSEQQKIVASDGNPSDFFGYRSHIDGNLLVIGAPLADSAYVFELAGGVWLERAKLVSSSSESFRFGSSVAVQGDSVFIGDSSEGASGALYVFARSGNSWVEAQRLEASDAGVIPTFGDSVAVDGDTLVVGAADLNSGFTTAGAAYVFTLSNSSWVEQAKLIASDASVGDRVGDSVAVSGDDIVLGAPADHADGNQNSAGAAYRFARSGTSWSESSKLIGSGASAGDEFGRAVAIQGDLALVGSQRTEAVFAFGLVDADGDGFLASVDCNDANPAINPGVVVDGVPLTGVDNDCDGDVDEDFVGSEVTFHADSDGDLFGDPAVAMTVSTFAVGGVEVSPVAPSGYVVDSSDCDDTDDAVFPGAVEVAGDGVDQDCDGQDTPAPPSAAPLLCGGEVVTVNLADGDVPTAGDDVIRGTAGDDVINGLGGDDIICGLQGDDMIFAGPGFDRVFAGAGNDVVTGGAGNDLLVGGAGEDTISGGNGNDRLQGGPGVDVLNGGGGLDRLAGGDGNDVLRGGTHADLLFGNLGRDELFGDGGDDVLRGGAWIDVMDGGAGVNDGCTLNDPGGLTETRINCEGGVFGR